MTDWPRCLICHRELRQDETARYACRRCELTIGGHLAELPGLHADLGQHLVPTGSAAGQWVTGGSVEPPLPVSEDVLSLLSHGGILTVLQTWEDDWRAELTWDPAQPVASVAGALAATAGFLRDNLLWACSSHPAVDEFAGDIRRLHATATRITRPVEKPTIVGHCPREDDGEPCGGRLELPPGGQTIRCHRCDTPWSQLQWLALRYRLEGLTLDAKPAAA